MSFQCEECGIQNINDLNEEYNWCNPCLESFKILANSGNFINRFSDEKNEKIDNLIQEMQSNIKGPTDVIFEWVPYNQFNSINEEGKGDFANACSAIWKDGPLIYSYFKKKFERVSNKKVVLKYLFNSKVIIDKFLDEVKIYSINYSNNICIYGISQDPHTKDYIIVLNTKALRKLIDDFNTEKRQKLEKLIKEKTKDLGFDYFEYTKFSNLKEIGKGVKRAKTDDENKVALKGFVDENSNIENVVNNFVKELKLLRTVHSCPNIIRFLGITKDNIGHVMVFEYANEGNLSDYFKKKFGSLEWKDKIHMAYDITCGLKYLHSKDIIHRNLHSNNILVNDGKLLIADFGLSKQIAEVTSNSTSNRMEIIGYIEPQCLRDVNYVKDKRSDVYSLGVLLWEITSEHPPFQNIEERGMLGYRISHSNLREEPIEGTPSKYVQLYQKCWDCDPEKRPNVIEVYSEILSQSDELCEEEWIKKKMEEEDICYFEYNKFSKFEEIGKGGFGVVRKAITDDGNQVALKGLIENKNSKIEENMIKNFVKELRLLRMVSYHDNINRFLGITKDNIGYVMVLEYANEGNLRDYLKKNFDSLQWENKAQMALDITRGLKCLHSKNIIHRDLHSKNILVNNGKLLIADFGLSKQLIEVTSNSVANMVGMIEYIEPQCLRSAHNAHSFYVRDKRSDVYSLGVLLWEITSGHPPFCNTADRNMLGYHIGYENLREEPIEDTPLEYRQLYQKCWDGDPEKRPDIDQVCNELLSQFNSNDINEQNQNEDSPVTSNNDSIQSGVSELCIETKFIGHT
ncbi:hypothetical protein RclHR1_00500016 [Rhizophagus clarus]|uniref:Kinase-like domain-containing protein n=1 Tax=Rhizophagus clarus TaxID=94130 RepID=A0A2Z6RJW2_9GLOM|nr:hypothetical protein RclHR1_00500016 [Rhizophagus clarus]GES97482.1 kinase-like domain-containing protein [Rhizophagus clarus]